MRARLVALVLACSLLATPVHAQNRAGKVAWGVVLGGVAGYELWAVTTHHQTMSQAVQRGPTWFKVGVGVGLGGLIVHLYFQK